MPSFQPDYRHIIMAAWNRQTKRTPLYDHSVAGSVIEAILGKGYRDLIKGDDADLHEGMRRYHAFFIQMGYDACPFEMGINSMLPGGGALGKHQPGSIHCMTDFQKYPWDELEDIYFKTYTRHFEALAKTLPKGMKAVGGVGNGVFESVQDLVGYTNLCYIRYDDPDLYAKFFQRMGKVMFALWKRVLTRYGDCFCLCRIGDDLGFKSNTLIPPEDIKRHIIPVYRRIIDMVHKMGKPFLLHSCGNIFEVMDDMIEVAGIDAKHSNEDTIASFQTWVDRYGNRIGNFGGLDCDVLIRETPETVKEVTTEIIRKARPYSGFAFGTGNSVPDYVPIDRYIAMNEAARSIRNE